MHLLGGHTKTQRALWGLMENGALDVAFQVAEHVGALRKRCTSTGVRSMCLADACLVRMVEIHMSI